MRSISASLMVVVVRSISAAATSPSFTSDTSNVASNALVAFSSVDGPGAARLTGNAQVFGAADVEKFLADLVAQHFGFHGPNTVASPS